MKTLFRSALLVPVMLMAVACGSTDDETGLDAVETSVEVASEEATTDTTTSDNGISPSEEGDAEA
ncbi:MAG: hypothetical protein ACO3XP_07935, partial [Ilumatobacteraceae bacterium]